MTPGSGILAPQTEDAPGLLLKPQPGLVVDGHKITLNGRRCMGVTTATSVIEKPGLIPWAVNLAVDHIAARWSTDTAFPASYQNAVLSEARNAHRARRDAGKDTGGQVAVWIEAHVRGLKPPLPADPMAVQAVEQFQDWELDHRCRWLAAEWPMAHPIAHIGGRMDLFGVIDRRPMVCDVKAVNSGRVFPENELQLSAYLRIMFDAAVIEGVESKNVGRVLLVVNKPKDGAGKVTFEPHEIETNIEEDWLAVCAAARLRQRIPRWEDR